MRFLPHRELFCSLLLTICCVTAAQAEDQKQFRQQGTPAIKSAGPLAFGPEGVLFVGDSQAASLWAISVPKASGDPAKAGMKLDNLEKRIAGLLGTTPADLLINDMAVQPGSQIVYLSVARGRGPDGQAALLKIDGQGQISEVPLENVAYDQVELTNVPKIDEKDRRGNSLRSESITDLAYVDGRVVLAGLSNEEFASKLRAISFPFTGKDLSTSVEIYHGAHGQYETRAPVRTFVPFVTGKELNIVAAYTCTPLVVVPVSALAPNSKVQGRTVAELGNRNRPLDMIAYERDGKQFLLVANSARGVMKVSTDALATQPSIKDKVADTAGLPYETVASLKGVEQLDKVGTSAAAVLVRGDDKTLTLQVIELP